MFVVTAEDSRNAGERIMSSQEVPDLVSLRGVERRSNPINTQHDYEEIASLR